MLHWQLGGKIRRGARLHPSHLIWQEVRRCCVPALQTRVLGTGSYGMLVQATDPDTDPHTEWAIELVARGPVMKVLESSITRQLLRHSSLQHPFFVSLREVRAPRVYTALLLLGCTVAITP